jgi:hypothetical protein
MSMIISLSGGTGSFASACIAHESGEPFRMVFADTLIEDEDCYRVLDEIEAKLGPVVRLVDGRTPWQVFADVGFIGNARTAHCSDILKRKQIRAWMDANTDPTDAMVIGMGLDEPERLKRAQVAWAPRPVRSLLAEHGWSHAQAVDCWRPGSMPWASRTTTAAASASGPGMTPSARCCDTSPSATRRTRRRRLQPWLRSKAASRSCATARAGTPPA